MVEFLIKVHPAQRQAYIPKPIVEALGYRLRAKADRYAAILWPEGVDILHVIESLRILLRLLELEANIHDRDY